MPLLEELLGLAPLFGPYGPQNSVPDGQNLPDYKLLGLEPLSFGSWTPSSRLRSLSARDIPDWSQFVSFPDGAQPFGLGAPLDPGVSSVNPEDVFSVSYGTWRPSRSPSTPASSAYSNLDGLRPPSDPSSVPTY